MTTYTWMGGAIGAWNLTSDWTPTGVPTSSTDEAFIPDSGTSVTMSGGAYAIGVLQVATGAFLTLDDGASLLVAPPGGVTDPTTLSGTLTVSADANGAASLSFQNGIVNNGTIVVSGVSQGQQAAVYYHSGVSGAGTTDITGGGLAVYFQSMTANTSFTGAGELQLDAANNPGSVLGFGGGDTINLAGLVWANQTASAILGAGNVLTVYEGGVGASINLDPSRDYTGYKFTLSDDMQHFAGGDGTLVSVTPCFGRGTRIATDKGEVAVEDLAVGDLVETASGALRPVRWIGHKSLDISRHPTPGAVHPVRVRAGAFGEATPAHDLWLSPGHNIAFEGALIPASALLNGVGVQQVERTRVEYWHVELDAHDVILAEGLTVESYLDTGNRVGFDNGGAFVEAHPDFKPRHWAATCLPLVEAGPQVERARALLRQRSCAQGYALTREADACLQADGERIAPIWFSSTRLAFVAPENAQSLKLVSHVFVPAHTMAGADDRRQLGLCVRRVQIDGADLPLDALEAPGWREAETEGGAFSHRWTSGAAHLPAGARIVVVDLAGEGLYWREPQETVAALFA